jgi:acyl carrier protein
MLAALGEIARQRGLSTVEARFVRSQRNRPALLFLEGVGLPFQTVRGDALVFRFPAGVAARIKYEIKYEPSAKPHAAVAAAAPARYPVPYARIASELHDAGKILDRVRAASAVALPKVPPTEPPRTDLERRLCRIWSEMLGVEPIGIRDNFFDLGGHSLLAVQLLSRLKDELDIELSLEVVYGAEFTVAELAKAIELREIELAGADRYAVLLAEVESLSDEEVRELLAKESAEAQ